ncbi:MAG: tyrosine-type recombinase/integrase [Sulfurimonas sp.]
MKTKALTIALNRRKLLNLLNDGEFMYTFSKGDFKIIFEYDTIEEYREMYKDAEEAYKNTMLYNYERVQAALSQVDTSPKSAEHSITFEELKNKFLAMKNKSDKVGDSSYKQYHSIFSKLTKYFQDRNIHSLNIEDFEGFRDYLISSGLVAKTINGIMRNVNQFIKFGVNYKYLKENNVGGLETLKEITVKKENFTDEEINTVLNYEDIEPNYKMAFKIAIYTGMRVSEIINIENENIREKDSITYIDLPKSKTDAGIRDIPICDKLLSDIKNINFPLFPEKTQSAVQKAILRKLYKILNVEGEKVFHTFRATFIGKAVNTFPEKLPIIQEIVGHSKSDNNSLTIDTYAKGFDLKLKKEIVDAIEYTS